MQCAISKYYLNRWFGEILSFLDFLSSSFQVYRIELHVHCACTIFLRSPFKKDYENKYFETLVCYKSITEEEYEHIEAKTDQTNTRRKTQGKEKWKWQFANTAKVKVKELGFNIWNGLWRWIYTRLYLQEKVYLLRNMFSGMRGRLLLYSSFISLYQREKDSTINMF